MKIFVSYSRRDAGDFADQIQIHLSTFNYDIFTDVNSIRAGEVWGDTIEENISNCDLFVVIVTPGALDSPHVEREVQQAQREEKTIIPCFHRSVIDSSIKWDLDKIQGVEFEVKYELTRNLYSKIYAKTINKPPEEGKSKKTAAGLTSLSAQWYLGKAKDFEELGEYDRALKQYEKAIEKEPENFLAKYNKALFLERIEKFNEALEGIEEAIDLEPKNTDVWYTKACILEKLQKYDDALKALYRDLKLNSKDIKSWIVKVDILLKLEKFNEALESLEEILKLDSNHLQSWKNKGYVLQKLERYHEAIECYNKVLSIDPNDQGSQKNRQSSLEALKRIFSSLMDEANLYYENQNYTKVIELCDQAIDIDKENHIAYLYKANALLQLSRYKDAIAYYNKVLAIYANNKEAVQNKKIAQEGLRNETIREIKSNYEKQNYTKVIELFDTIEDSVNDSFLEGYKAESFYILGNYEDALKCYETILAMDPKNLDILHKKVNTLDKLEKYEDALKTLDKIIALDQSNISALKYKGHILINIEKYIEAFYYYSKVLVIEPADTEAKKEKKSLQEIILADNIFIDYVDKDSDKAKQLYLDLKEYDLNPLLYRELLLPSAELESLIEEALKNSKCYILIISKNSFSNEGHLSKQYKAANNYIGFLSRPKMKMIPVRIDECEISYKKLKEQLIDLFPNWNDGIQKILLSMGIKDKPFKPSKLNSIRWKILISAIEEKKCIPFIGSLALNFYNKIDNAAFITHDEVAREWAEKYDYPFYHPYELSKVAQYVAITQIGNEVVTKQILADIVRRIDLPEFGSSKYNKSPHAILADLDLPIYITTNYDLFMEEALKCQGKEPRSEICKWNDEIIKFYDNEIEQKSYKPTPQKPLVFHLCGSIDVPESLVLTERDHFEFVINTNKDSEKDMIPTFLKKALSTSTLLFIGYELHDINFHSILQGPLSFMYSAPRLNNNIAVIRIPVENNSVKIEKITKYMQEYTNHIFKIGIYWDDMDNFMRDLKLRRKRV